MRRIEDVIQQALIQINRLLNQDLSGQKTDDVVGDAGGTDMSAPGQEQAARLALVLKFRQSTLHLLLSKMLTQHDQQSLKALIKYLKEHLSEETLTHVVKTLSAHPSKPIAVEALKEIVDTVDLHFRTLVDKVMSSEAKVALTNHKTPSPFSNPLKPELTRD